jgi:hypothetical protein
MLVKHLLLLGLLVCIFKVLEKGAPYAEHRRIPSSFRLARCGQEKYLKKSLTVFTDSIGAFMGFSNI